MAATRRASRVRKGSSDRLISGGNPMGPPRLRSRLELKSEVHEHFARVVTVEQVEKRLRSVVEALANGLLVNDVPRLHEGCHLREEFRLEVEVIAHQEALHPGARGDQRHEVARA